VSIDDSRQGSRHGPRSAAASASASWTSTGSAAASSQARTSASRAPGVAVQLAVDVLGPRKMQDHRRGPARRHRGGRLRERRPVEADPPPQTAPPHDSGNGLTDRRPGAVRLTRVASKHPAGRCPAGRGHEADLARGLRDRGRRTGGPQPEEGDDRGHEYDGGQAFVKLASPPPFPHGSGPRGGVHSGVRRPPPVTASLHPRADAGRWGRSGPTDPT